MGKYKIAFLLDKKNNWLETYIKQFIKKQKDQNLYNIFYTTEISNNDMVFILGFTKILSNNFLQKNSLNLVVHESNLPLGKGFSPIQWQILEGKNVIDICLIEATDKVDSGDILMKKKLVLNGSELYKEIRKKQAESTLELIEKFIKNYPILQRKKQFGYSTFYRKRNPLDSELDPNKSILDNFNLLRIANNDEWPCFFIHKGIKYTIKIYKD